MRKSGSPPVNEVREGERQRDNRLQPQPMRGSDEEDRVRWTSLLEGAQTMSDGSCEHPNLDSPEFKS